VDAWCARRAIARGVVLRLDQVWQLAQAWYAGHADATWRGRSSEEAVAVFRSVGLRGPFWTL
jgi:hypothetical protein